MMRAAISRTVSVWDITSVTRLINAYYFLFTGKYQYSLRLRLFYLSHTQLYRDYITSSEMYSLHLTHPK